MALEISGNVETMQTLEGARRLLTTVAMVVVVPAGLWLSRYLGT
jgi:hypothetical protein